MAALKDLIVWRRAVELVAECYRISAKFPRDERYELTRQLRRAALSIPANIAEGNGRQAPKQFLQFLAIARGSLKEVETYLAVVELLTLASPESLKKARELVDEIGRLMIGLRRHLLTQSRQGR